MGSGQGRLARRLLTWCALAFVAGVLLGSSLPAQPLPGTHSVSSQWPATNTLAEVHPDSLAAFCATAWQIDEAAKEVVLIALRPAGTPTNPVCPPNEAAVVVRPACVFNAPEMLYLPRRSAYVVLLCRPNGVLQAIGLPLGILPTSQRSTANL